MSEPASRVRVPCTFPSCARFFSSVAEMKKHKVADPEHEYCSRCDEDFQDEERLLIHKIKTNKHIVCPICGSEYRSESGRDHHIRQNHRTDQDLTCYCKAKFKNATGLMAHIEKSECPEISPSRLMKERAKKIAVRQALAAGEYKGPQPAGSDPDDDDHEINGGVSVSNIEHPNKEAMRNQPKSDDDTKSTTSATLSLKHWPRLGSQKMGPRKPEPSDLMAFSELSLKDKAKENSGKLEGQKTGHSNTNTSQLSSDIWKHEDSQARLPPSDGGLFGQGLPDAGEVLRILWGHWDPTEYFDSFNGLYTCPCGCGHFNDLRTFEEHLLMKADVGVRVRCPRCMRIFNSTAALVAHCESATTRCNLKFMDTYAQILSEITGGVIEPTGYLNDGSIKYDTGRLTGMPKKTTIGVDLDKAVKGRLT